MQFRVRLQEFRRVLPDCAHRGKGLDRLTFGQLKACQAKPGLLISRIKLEFMTEFRFCVLDFSGIQIGFAEQCMQAGLPRFYGGGLVVFLRSMFPEVAFK
jgi:hypothetical protein